MPHDADDVDSSVFAGHHSLGPKATQAAPGNHSHSALSALGTESVLFGPVPGQGSTKLVKQGSVIIALNGASQGLLAWTEGAFPNGVISVIVISGDAVAFAGSLSCSAYSLGGCTITAQPAPGAINVRANYIAVGW